MGRGLGRSAGPAAHAGWFASPALLEAWRPGYDRRVLAHAGGIDELAIFLFPIVIGGGFWLLTRQRRHADDEADGSPAAGAGGVEPSPISAPHREGPTRLHTLMDAPGPSDDDPVTGEDRRGEPARP